MENLLLVQVARQVVDVRAELLDLPVLGLGDIQGQDMHLAPVVRKVGGDLLADEDVRQMGDFQGAVDGVVIRDGHMAHAPALGDLIELQRFGEAFRAADLLQYPLAGPFGVFGVNMNVDLHAFILLRISSSLAVE